MKTISTGIVIYRSLYIAFIRKVCVFTLNTTPAILHCYSCEEVQTLITDTDPDDYRMRIYQEALSNFPVTVSQ